MTEAGAIERLVAWAEDAGACVDPVEIRTDEAGSRGLYVRRAVRASELLLRVPPALIVTHELLAETPVGGAIAAIEGKLHSRYVLLGAWLAAEQLDPGSPWRPYIDALPASLAYMPTLRPADELAALDGTRARALVERRVEELRWDLTVVGDLVDEVSALSRDAMVWGTHAARTRGFYTRHSLWPALVPIADMANHGEANARFGFADRGDFEVHATIDLDAGTEVLHDYGRQSNARWLVGYGFALEDNPEDEVALHLAGSAQPVFVGAAADDRFHIAALVATGADEIAAAAERATALVAQAPPVAEGDEAWRRTCAIVRAGELAVLARIAARAGELYAAARAAS